MSDQISPSNAIELLRSCAVAPEDLLLWGLARGRAAATGFSTICNSDCVRTAIERSLVPRRFWEGLERAADNLGIHGGRYTNRGATVSLRWRDSIVTLWLNHDDDAARCGYTYDVLLLDEPSVQALAREYKHDGNGKPLTDAEIKAWVQSSDCKNQKTAWTAFHRQFENTRPTKRETFAQVWNAVHNRSRGEK